MYYNAGYYDIYLYDYTAGGGCNAIKSENFRAVNYEQFIDEIPTWQACYGFCSGVYILPEFSSNTVYDAMINYNPISNLCNPCYVDTMSNGGYPNINLGTISYSSSQLAYFTQIWVTSQGT